MSSKFFIPLLAVLVLASVHAAAQTDAEFHARTTQLLQAVFSELDGLEDVTVSAQSGVVTLGGTAGSKEAADQALQIAGDREGVIAVENQMTVDQAVGTRLGPVAQRLSDQGQSLLRSLPLFAVSVGVVLICWWVGRWLAASTWIKNKIVPNPFVGELVAWALRAALLLVGLLLAFQIMDATALLGSLLGGLGVLGLALGFAVRDTVENFIASILLSIRQPFSTGDLVEVEGHTGSVLRLTTRATILMDSDGNHIRIPNAAVYKGTSVNYTRNPHRRFKFEVGVDASIEPTEAQEIALEALARIPTVLQDPAPGCLVQSLGDSNVVLSVTGWVDQREAAFGKTRSASIALVKQAMEDAEIAMPEPIYNVRIARGEVPVSGPNRPRLRKQAVTQTSAPTRSDLAPDKPVEELDSGEADLLNDAAPKE